MYTYIKNNDIYEFEFLLDSRYNIGSTYEDMINGKWVELSKELVDFYNLNKNASIYEIWNLKLINSTIPELTLEESKQLMIDTIKEYDSSDTINKFLIDDTYSWFDKTTRLGLINSVKLEQELEHPTSILWINNISYVLDCKTILKFLQLLELYAIECNNVTNTHIKEVLALKTIEEVQSYNYRTNYPNYIKFNYQ